MIQNQWAEEIPRNSQNSQHCYLVKGRFSFSENFLADRKLRLILELGMRNRDISKTALKKMGEK